jgi:hypothetical protein
MPRIENTSPRQYDLSAKGFVTVQVPAATKNESGGKTNGSADVDAEMLKVIKAEPWGKAVFESGDLVETASDKTKAAPTK